MSATPPLPTTPPPLPPELRAKLLAAVAKEPSPPRARVRAVTLVLFVIAAAIVVYVWQRPMDAIHLFDRITFYRFHPDKNPVPMGGGFEAFEKDPDHLAIRSVIALVVAAISAGVSVIAFSRGRSMVGRRSQLLVAVVFLTPIALLLWKFGIASAAGIAGADTTRPGFRCLKVSLLMGAIPFAFAIYLRRASDPLHPLTTGAALGVATGAISWTFVDLTCPIADPTHLLLGHVLPILIFAMLGSVVGHLLLRIRAR